MCACMHLYIGMPTQAIFFFLRSHGSSCCASSNGWDALAYNVILYLWYYKQF